MRELYTEIEIDASAETVWDILLDFTRYPAWNPFVTSIEGPAVEGERITIHLEPPSGKTMTFKPTVVSCEEPWEFAWLGHLFIPGIFDGKHIFEIAAHGKGKVQFVQREEFRGLIVPLLWKSLDTDTRSGFEAMNIALKARAESKLKDSFGS